jgi:hypothetical protein
MTLADPPISNRVTPDLERLIFEHHDNCVRCGYAFKEGDTTHSGYGPSDEPLYVCGDCATSKLREIARRTIFMARHYEVPASTSTLWRYMDFTKYASLLSTSSLYFPCAASFDDTFEGAKGLATNKHKWDQHYLEFFRRAIRNPPDGRSINLTDEEVEANAQRLLRDIETMGTRDRERTFISCWHESQYESEAMWRLYSTSMTHAVAIQTTVDAIYRALGRNPRISIGRVEYIHFDRSFSDLNGAFWRKRKSFEHEREVRLLMKDHQASTPGLGIPCDVTILVQSVVVSPKAPDWLFALVQDLTSRYGYQIPVRRSRLVELPFF